MKRIVLAYAAAAALGVAAVGCSENEQMNDPFSKELTKKEPKAEYFEVRREGKTYVLGSPESLKAFNNGDMPKTKPVQMGDKTVYVESSGYTTHNRLVADYKKQHSIK